MNNIEIKFAINSRKDLEQLLVADSDCRFIETMQQTDIYFCTQTRRLKLRMFPDGKAELIYYSRENRAEARHSYYQIYASSDPDRLRMVLTESLGVKTIVIKERKLWMFKNVRIHLDTITNLGKFIEFESVIDQHHPEEVASRNLQEILDRFSSYTLIPIPVSYADLLLQRESKDA